MSDKEFEKFEENLFNTFLERNPQFATHLGIHDYDHLLPDGSLEKHLEDIELMENAKETLESFDPEELSVENRFDRKIGLHVIEMMLFNDKKIEQWKKNPSVPGVIGGSIFPLLKREFAPFKERLKSIKGRIEGVPDFIESSKSALVEPDRLWIDIAIESVEQLPMLFKLVLMIAQGYGIEEDSLKELSEAVDQADQAMEEYSEWLEDKRAEANDDPTIGEELFNELLKKRKLGYTADEILELGERYFQDTETKMDSYAAKIDAEKDAWEVLKDITSKTPSDLEDALRWYRRGLQEAKEFIIDKDLCTIPEKEEIEVTETPEYLRHIIPYAAYMGPAKFDDMKKGIYLVTPPPDKKWNKMSYWDIRNTTVHEGYPGHHLQISCATAVEDLMIAFSHSIETIEGWAHYCEEMMKEHGFDDTPEARLIQNRDILWRAARIIVDVKLSTGKMSFDEAVEFLVEKVKLQEPAARAEVKRYTQNPAYQLSYLLGKHMILELKEEVKEKMGDRYSEKFFHDTILYTGSVPIKYLRERFYERI
ncbi:MAG: DUF885 domain-containing protein [Thermoplasmata archaeon]